MNITPEEIYSSWHYEINLAKGISNVRRITNFDNARKKEAWQCFVIAANIINRNDGLIDYRILTKALAWHHKGFFHPKFLTHRSGFKIYREYLAYINEITDPVYIRNSILYSMKFVIEYCKQKEIKSFSEYLEHDKYFIPSIIKHLKSGSISYYFLACIENCNLLFKNYSEDVLYDYAKDFDKQYSLYRLRVVGTLLVEDLVNKVPAKINSVLNKKQE